MQQLSNIEQAFKRFDLKTKAIIYGFKQEAQNGKDFKRLREAQTNRDFDNTLRKQKEY